MKTTRLFALAALLLASSCSKEGDGTAANGQQELRLTSAIEAATRGNVQSTEIVPGEKVRVGVMDAEAEDLDLLYDCELTAQAGGALTGETMYFPQSGNGVIVIATHGQLNEEQSTFTVAADQSEGGGVQTMCIPTCSSPCRPHSARRTPWRLNSTTCSPSWNSKSRRAPA